MDRANERLHAAATSGDVEQLQVTWSDQLIPLHAADARSSGRAAFGAAAVGNRGRGYAPRRVRPSTRAGRRLEDADGGQLLLRSTGARHKHWLVWLSSPAARRIFSRATILATCNGWMHCQEREDGACVGGSGRSFARGRASNRRRRRPECQEQRRVEPWLRLHRLRAIRSWQLPSRQEHSAHLGRDVQPHTRGRAAHRRRRETRCPEQQRVGPLGPTVMPAASAARYSTRQPTSRQAHCAHLGRDGGPHARGRAAHRRRRETRCPKHSRVGPVCRLHRPHACAIGTVCLGRDTALIWAAYNDHMLGVKQLIAAGAALDVQNSNGYGPCAE